jgi:hypothetical protein
MLMSAYLDKSQGITFVYSNIYQLYQTAKNAKLDDPFIIERLKKHAAPAPAVSKVIKAKDAVVGEFQPAELKPAVNERPFEVPMGVKEAEEKAMRQNMRPLANIQKNLNELTDAHDKLRFLLQELEALTKKKS